MITNHIYNDTNSSISIGDKELKHPESLHTCTYIKHSNDEINVMLSAQPGNIDPAWICLAVHINGKAHVIYNGKPEDMAAALAKMGLDKG